jgi:hypothetical protein
VLRKEIGVQVCRLRIEQHLAAFGLQPDGEQAQVAAIGFQRVLRQPVFQPQRVAEFIDLRLTAQGRIDRHAGLHALHQ